MKEKSKTWLLAGLVLLSLMQSYLLAYSMPGIGATFTPRQDYIKTEPMGTEEQVQNVIFPEDMVLHFGNDKHTVLYPGMNFYNLIYDRMQGREFKGFQSNKIYVVDWDTVRERDIGVELRFGGGVPVELLGESFKLDGDLTFLNDVINRIWIYKNNDREEVRTYFFSADGTTVYESVRADLTVNDVQNYVGFGEYSTPYRFVEDELYIPTEPLQAVESVVGYETYTPEQMQRNLFLDPSETRTINDRNGSQIYTDGKRGLQVELDGKWISYTDPVAGQGNGNNLSANVYASIQFINQHGGWDGMHRYLQPIHREEGQAGHSIRYQQYYGSYPVIPAKPFLFGHMQLRLQQGVVSEYERSLITLKEKADSKEVRWLPGGDSLGKTLSGYARRSEVVAVYPAALVSQLKDSKLRFKPVWAVRLTDGSQDVLMPALPDTYDPLPKDSGVTPGNTGGGAAGKGGTNTDSKASNGKTGDTGSAADKAGHSVKAGGFIAAGSQAGSNTDVRR
ncbi:YycH family regulatory protein [Paenibacillus spongiae]|uniref:Two-component system activity regulator YycH n=1 Tax=Paenibacillus spongiae TaxID=2909671 RepID=A0ABY5S9G1_9BACL|nr:two-component system activity regulator YycH [Paenibacillus spongiae]UVI30299.1 two-component system activity regulator YycH [Paenibacillus spongiae]